MTKNLTNQEIALELTKLYVEHTNRLVEQKYAKSRINELHIAHAYQYFEKAVNWEIDINKNMRAAKENKD